MASVKISADEPDEETNSDQEEIQNNKADWRGFIFLPFQTYWQITITLVTFVTFFMNVGMYGFFHGEQPIIVSVIYYAIELTYLFDVTMTIMHRNMREYRQYRHYYPMPLTIIVIDIISLLPYNELILLANFAKKNYEGARETWLKVLLRIFHLVYNYSLLRKEAGVNHVVLITITTFFQYAFISLISSVIFDSIPYWVGGNMTWHHFLFDHKFDINNGFDNFTLAYTTVGSTYLHNWTGIIRGENASERLMMCLLMLYGYLWHVMIYSGQLTASILHNLRKQFRYANRLRHIQFVLEDWGITGKLRECTLNYYWQLWEKRHGMFSWPKSFNLVPPFLQKETTLDIFWDALRHSHLFAGVDIAFKRELTLMMKSDFLLAGDYLYTEDELKNKMVFISTGVIQVLSDEDLESDIVSLSAGTIICELSCFMPTKSIANYRAATYCDIQTISYRSLMRTLRKYRNRRSYLASLVELRLSNAKHMNNLVKNRRAGIYHYFSDEYDTSIKRLKRNWRQMIKHSVMDKKYHKLVTNAADVTFCSSYLDLIVLSNKVELNVRAICLQGKCPCVIDPDSGFCKVLNYVLLIGFLIQAFRIPYIISFTKKTSAYEFSVLLILDVLNYFDLFLQMITAIKVNNRIISDPKKLAVMNLKRFSFIVDIVATLPFDYIARGFGLSDSEVIATYLKLPHVIRVYRVFTVIIQKQNNLKTNQILIRCTKFLILHLLALYHLACALFVMSCFSEICSGTGWMIHGYILTNRTNIASRYLDRALIYSISVFLGVSHSVVFPYDVKDMWAYHFVAGIGYFTFSFCLAELTAVTVCEHDARYRYTENYRMLKQFMEINRIKEDLQVSALEFFDFQWHFNEAIETTGPRGVLCDSSEIIQSKVIMERMIDCLYKAHMFSNCPLYIVEELAKKCNLKVMPTGSTISNVGQHSTFLNVIMRGFCELISSLPNDHGLPSQVLTVGASFPMLSVLHHVPAYCDVNAVTVVEILYISRRDLISTMKRHIEYFGYIFDTIEWHMDEFSGTLLNTEIHSTFSNTRENPLHPKLTKKNKKAKLNKQYNGNPFNMQEYKAAFKKYGIFIFTRFLFIPCGINPYGQFYFYYEIFRCTMGVAQSIIAILSANILYPTWYINPVIRTIFAINVIDMYIRAHCHYYNRQGILVKHPLYTAKHYCQTALLLDIYCSFPITMIGINVIFPKPKRIAGVGLTYLVTKSAAMYRVLLAVHHLAQKYEGTVSHWLSLTKVMVIVITIMGMAVAMLFIMSCFLGYEKMLVCEPKNWMVEQSIDVKTIPEYMLVCTYIVVTYFSTSFQGVAPVKQAAISRYLKALMALIIITRFYMLSYISGSGVGMNAKLTEYRTRLKQFMAFISVQNVRPLLAKQICEDCQYNWERGSDMEIGVLSKYNNTLVLDLCEFMFTKAARYSTIFEEVDIEFIRMLGTNFKLQHFKKGSVIIQANDIQRNLYFVSKGTVEISIADIEVEILEVGGIFGCFNKRGETRQTISAVAVVHVDLLVIQSSLFHELAADDPAMQIIAKKASMLNYEYFKSKGEHMQYFSKENVTSKSNNLSRSSIEISKGLLHSLYKTVNKSINQESLWFTFMEYFISVHLAPLFCIVYLLNFYILHATFDLPFNNFEKWFLISFDCIFICRIILEYFLQYIDPETGVAVKNPAKISRRYVYSFNFWLDLLGVLPTEVIFSFIHRDNFMIRVASCNRLLRFIYLIRYYYRQNRKLNISRHLRWTYLLYISTFQIMFLATLWRLVACPDLICPYQYHASHNAPTVLSTDYIESLSIILTYTVNMFTATGLRLMAPRQIKNMALSIIMAICSLLTISLLLSGFVSILVVDNFSMSRFERQIDDLKIYIQDRELSPRIKRSIWSHLTQLWYCYQGEHISELALSAPKFLREQLYKELYGHHIQNNYYFMNTHVDFIRQLLLHIKRTIYFPGYTIVQIGDIDECIYFIHKGQVQQYTKIETGHHVELSGSSSVSAKLIPPRLMYPHAVHSLINLIAGQSFGEAQGLFNIPHTSTYKAITNVELLSLKQSDWNYLLRWFPASLDILKKRAKESGIIEQVAKSDIEATGIASIANVFKFSTVH